MSIFEAHNMPFAAAFVLVLLLALVQAIGLGDAEVDPSTGVEVDTGMQPGALDGVFTLLGIGRVPLTIWLAVFLFGFAAIGVSIQSLSDNLLGAPLYRCTAGSPRSSLPRPPCR